MTKRSRLWVPRKFEFDPAQSKIITLDMLEIGFLDNSQSEQLFYLDHGNVEFYNWFMLYSWIILPFIPTDVFY